MTNKQSTITDNIINKALDKIEIIQKELNEVLIDRKKIIKLSIISIIAKENIVLLGPPGTAKSMLAVEICNRISDKGNNKAKIFQRLLTKYTDETELFESGMSIEEEEWEDKGKKIKRTKIKKESKGMLPEHDIAFLDEIFKGTSAILNALLTLINEREYFTSDGKRIKSNLITVFAASNERPEADSGLEALYDRFLIRYRIEYLKESNFLKLLKMETNNKEPEIKISKDELIKLNKYLDKIQIPEKVFSFIIQIKKIVEKNQVELGLIMPSDRRMKNSLKLLKANALLDRRLNVEEKDVRAIYPFVLWDTAPGNSSNLENNFKDLISFIEKFESPKLKEFDEYEKAFINKDKEMSELVNDINAAFTERDTEKQKKLIKSYNEKEVKFIGEIDTYINRIEEKLTENLEDNEEKLLEDFKEKLKEAKEEYKKFMLEYLKLLRDI